MHDWLSVLSVVTRMADYFISKRYFVGQLLSICLLLKGQKGKVELRSCIKMSVLFWVVTPYRFVGSFQRFGGTYCLEDGDNMFLRNVGIYLRVFTASQHRAYRRHNIHIGLLKIHLVIFSTVYPFTYQICSIQRVCLLIKRWFVFLRDEIRISRVWSVWVP
jgi:hypothetical protein